MAGSPETLNPIYYADIFNRGPPLGIAGNHVCVLIKVFFGLAGSGYASVSSAYLAEVLSDYLGFLCETFYELCGFVFLLDWGLALVQNLPEPLQGF